MEYRHQAIFLKMLTACLQKYPGKRPKTQTRVYSKFVHGDTDEGANLRCCMMTMTIEGATRRQKLGVGIGRSPDRGRQAFEKQRGMGLKRWAPTQNFLEFRTSNHPILFIVETDMSAMSEYWRNCFQVYNLRISVIFQTITKDHIASFSN